MSQTLEDAIQELLRNSKRYLGSKVPATIMEISRQSRRISDLAKLRIWCGTEKTVYVVAYRPFIEAGEKQVELLAQKFKQIERLHAAFAGSDRFSVVKPVAYFPQYRAVVTEESQGIVLEELARVQCRRFGSDVGPETLAEHFRQCGVWLKIFQSMPNEYAGDRLDLPSLISYIRVRLERLRASDDLSAALAERVLRTARTLVLRATPADLKLVAGHGDFGPHNVLVDGARLTIMDMHGANAESVYFDLANFYEVLEKMILHPLYSRSAVRRLQSAFLEGYDEKFDGGNSMFLLFRIRQVLCQLVSWRTHFSGSLTGFWKYRWAVRKYLNWLDRVGGAVLS